MQQVYTAMQQQSMLGAESSQIVISTWSWRPKTVMTDLRVLQQLLLDLDLNHPLAEVSKEG
jgi:hypothetical protein